MAKNLSFHIMDEETQEWIEIAGVDRLPVVTPQDMVKTHIQDIAVAVGIPERMLDGSAYDKLSERDKIDWSGPAMRISNEELSSLCNKVRKLYANLNR